MADKSLLKAKTKKWRHSTTFYRLLKKLEDSSSASCSYSTREISDLPNLVGEICSESAINKTEENIMISDDTSDPETCSCGEREDKESGPTISICPPFRRP